MYETIANPHLLCYDVMYSFAQDPWKITASKINPANYYGIIVANAMLGIVSSPEAFKVKDVLLAGAFDLPVTLVIWHHFFAFN